MKELLLSLFYTLVVCFGIALFGAFLTFNNYTLMIGMGSIVFAAIWFMIYVEMK